MTRTTGTCSTPPASTSCGVAKLRFRDGIVVAVRRPVLGSQQHPDDDDRRIEAGGAPASRICSVSASIGSISAGDRLRWASASRRARLLAGSSVMRRPERASDVTCHCGAKGCLDVVASGEALAREALAAAKDGRSRYLAEMVERNGDVTRRTMSAMAPNSATPSARSCWRDRDGWSAKAWRRWSICSIRGHRAGRRARPFRRHPAGGGARGDLPPDRIRWRPATFGSCGSELAASSELVGAAALAVEESLFELAAPESGCRSAAPASAFVNAARLRSRAAASRRRAAPAPQAAVR